MLPVAPAGADPFASVRQKWNSHLESDREVCAVLAAVTESITESVGDTDTQPSPTAYWAALMTTLECAGVDTDDKAIAAVIYLLSLVSPCVPTAVLQRQCAAASALFLRVLTAHAKDGSQALLKAALTCLGRLAAAQDAAGWAGADATKAYVFVHTFHLFAFCFNDCWVTELLRFMMTISSLPRRFSHYPFEITTDVL